MGVLGMIFRFARSTGLIVAAGFVLTATSTVFSNGCHTYQAEIFLTRMRSTAVSTAYSQPPQRRDPAVHQRRGARPPRPDGRLPRLRGHPHDRRPGRRDPRPAQHRLEPRDRVRRGRRHLAPTRRWRFTREEPRTVPRPARAEAAEDAADPAERRVR